MRAVNPVDCKPGSVLLRALALALSQEPAIEGEDRQVVETVLVDLAANETGLILLAEDAELVSELSGAPALEACGPNWVGAVWRQLRRHSSVGLLGAPGESLPALCSRVSLELQLAKLVSVSGVAVCCGCPADGEDPWSIWRASNRRGAKSRARGKGRAPVRSQRSYTRSRS